jgi:C1A family cysteine protease
MSYKVYHYGWLPDLPDHRDQLYSAPAEITGVLPANVDLRALCPPVYDQGQLGSCTANAIAAAIQFDQMKQKTAQIFNPSRLFIYYNKRVIEYTVASDSGAQIRDGIKSVGKSGDCPETEWPYVIAKFKTKPPAKYYSDALKYKAVLYQRLTPVLNLISANLASDFWTIRVVA